MPIVISRSLWRRLLVMSLAMATCVLLYEAGTFDSLSVPPTSEEESSLLAAGTPHAFTATAYCKGTTTASGVPVRAGIAAADPAILPVGSVVSITTRTAKHNGVYTIMDTGPKVQRRLVDIYIWSCYEALAFGRQPIELTILRLGWNPANSVPSLIDQLFRRREADRATRPAMPPVANVPAIDDESSDTFAIVEPTNNDEIDPEVEPSSPDEASPTDASQVEPSDSPSQTAATTPAT